MAGKVVLVSGGAGFIGSALCRWIVQNTNYEVEVVDSLTYAGSISSLDPVMGSGRVRFHRVDIRDFVRLQEVFEAIAPCAVFHLAAESHVDNSITGPRAFIETNIVGTFNMLEAARAWYLQRAGSERERFRFIHVSTDEVFGSLGADGLFDEETRYDPSSPYSATKAGSDHLARAWWRTYGLPTVVTNCSNNYGPYQYPEKLIPLMIRKALGNEELPIYGDGLNVRDWLHVTDHCRGLWAAFLKGRPGQTYNFGGNAQRTNIAVVEAICEIVDKLRPGPTARRDLIRFVVDRPGHDYRYAVATAKARADLSWEPLLSFESGLYQTVEWYLANPHWPDKGRIHEGTSRVTGTW